MSTNNIVNFLFEIASLRRLTRSHRQVISEVNDNISDHSFRVAIIGMILANLEKCDANKVLKMCLFHDLPEARTGDANFINQQYLKIDEEGALEDQMDGLPIAEEVLALAKEFKDQKSKEAILAKDADKLDQMLLQQEYFFKDKENRTIWHKHTLKSLQSEIAKKLASEIMIANPLEWLYEMSNKKLNNNVRE
jgi:putative hydrolases of HD superfamily